MTDIWLIRHGDTEWTKAGRHTGRTDLDLTHDGIEVAKRAKPFVEKGDFDLIATSPLLRARRTADEMGVGDRVEVLAELTEFDYGEYEGLTTEAIQALHPGWSIWLHGCPGGETPEEVAQRAERVLERIAEHDRVLLVGHAHALRMLAARYLDLPPRSGGLLGRPDPGALSHLGVEHGRNVIESWNASPAGQLR